MDSSDRRSGISRVWDQRHSGTTLMHVGLELNERQELVPNDLIQRISELWFTVSTRVRGINMTGRGIRFEKNEKYEKGQNKI